MDDFEKLKGQWVHSLPWDTDDYMAIYEIAGTASRPMVIAHDYSDGEKFEISNIEWDGDTLIFETLMPSTRRRGVNRFKLVSEDEVSVKFTFTVEEVMHRKPYGS